MSCCNNGPLTIRVYPNAPAVCPDTPEYTFSNANLSGQGVFFDHTGSNVQFYGIASSGGTIDVTLDVPNNVINLELDADIVAGNFPDSTTVVKGKTAYATNAEALAKTSTTKALTPSNLAAMAASTTFAGLTEYATEAETGIGTSTVLAVTPAGLTYVLNTLLTQQVTANAVTRAAATPLFVGQLLLQIDTGVLYRGTALSAGSWSLAAVPLTGVAAIPGLTLTSDSGELEFASTETRTTMLWSFETGLYVDQILNIQSSTELRLSNTPVPASSVLTTAGLGTMDSLLINQFLTDQNTEEWTVSGVTESRTFDASSADLAATRQALGTLLNDLAATRKPVYP